ncbi:MAG TPA: hypothetical protein VMC84_03845 [Methanocella sp.]|nr:hypothetical protein [Methanocella sp.]HTY90286.1 hypothetical protein [Methanocella sp.]
MGLQFVIGSIDRLSILLAISGAIVLLGATLSLRRFEHLLRRQA